MSRRGPGKTPTKILEQRGSWRAKTRKKEPIPPDGQVKPHAVLDATARALFQRITKEIAKGVVKPCDAHVLAIACQAFSDWVRLTKELRTEGETSENIETGVRYSNPKVFTRDKARDTFFKLAREFGLTPSSRANLAVDGDAGANDEAAQFFKLTSA